MKKVLFTAFIVVCILGALLSIWQAVVSILFGELGRLLAYSVLAVLCVEISILTILKRKELK